MSATLPEDLLGQTDALARRLERSRSWVIASALRAHLSRELSTPSRAVIEPAGPPDALAEVAAARRQHLAAELALSPAERLRRAEELGRLARQRQRPTRRLQALGFESYDDFYRWRRLRLLGE